MTDLLSDTGAVGGRLEDMIRRDGRSPWALSKAGSSAVVLGPIPDRQFRIKALDVLSEMLVAFDRQRADQVLKDGQARVVTGIDMAVAERLVATVGRQQTSGKIVSAQAGGGSGPTPLEIGRNAVLMGGATALGASLFAEPWMIAVIGGAGLVGGAIGTMRQKSVVLLDGTPRSAPEMPPEVANVPEAVARVMVEQDAALAVSLESVERFAFYVLGKLADPADLLSVLGGAQSELGQAAIALAKAGLAAGTRGDASALSAAASQVITHREALAAAEKLTDGTEINASLAALVQAVNRTAGALG